jgi:hypothetical protein
MYWDMDGLETATQQMIDKGADLYSKGGWRAWAGGALFVGAVIEETFAGAIGKVADSWITGDTETGVMEYLMAPLEAAPLVGGLASKAIKAGASKVPALVKLATKAMGVGSAISKSKVGQGAITTFDFLATTHVEDIGRQTVQKATQYVRVVEEVAKQTVETGTKVATKLVDDMAQAMMPSPQLVEGVMPGSQPISSIMDDFGSKMDEIFSFSDNAKPSGLNTLNKVSPSQVLRQNMKVKGVQPPPYPNAAHHIVAESAEAAAPARKYLADLGIDINSAENGIFLRYTEKGKGPLHLGSHKNAYYKEVNDRILNATTKEEALQTLKNIGTEIFEGNFIW